MPVIDLVVESEASQSVRIKQLSAMFDVPLVDKSTLKWQGEMNYNIKDWNIGLIVGPSGCGKTQIARHLFGDNFDKGLEWKEKSVIDDFSNEYSMQDVAGICQAVGFNTIPSWMRPYSVLSNGEKFRVELARKMLESKEDIIIVDEFTSVVDRQVAQIGAHAVQKYVRRKKRKFIAISCHYDIIDWLQPDWIFEPATMKMNWRSVQRRPEIECKIARVKYDVWKLFAPYHYLTASLNKSARCYCMFVKDEPVSFAGLLPKPNRINRNIWGISRMVTLPDFQGLGLAFVIMNFIGSIYKSIGKYLHMYPAHPNFIRSFCRSDNWQMRKKPGTFNNKHVSYSISPRLNVQRPCGTFRYIGPAFDDKAEALKIIEGK